MKRYFNSKGYKKNKYSLRLISSTTKIWNQLMMFLVLGVSPFVFPRYLFLENRLIVFFNVSIALVTSIIFEIWRVSLEKKKKNAKYVLNIQLLTSVILLTIFLHFFGRINGPFFVLYLLTVMESFLNGNIIVSNISVLLMGFATCLEFGWLLETGEVKADLYSIMSFFVRIMSLIFMRAYGFSLAYRIQSEKRAKRYSQKTNKRLKEVSGQLKNANERLTKLDKKKDEFISVAAHELRAPLTAVRGYLSMLVEGDGGKLTKTAKEFIRGAIVGVEREIRLVNDMLNVSRIEENRLKFDMEKIRLGKIVKEVFEEFKLDIKEKELKFELIIEKGIKDEIWADEDRMHEVVANFVSNAVKYTDRGKIGIKLFNSSKGIIRFEICDTGYGISKKEQKKLFSKFYRASSSSGKVLGTGLGLYIVKLIIKRFKGRLGVESEVNMGSTFWFEMPLKK